MEPRISPQEFKEHYEKLPEDLQESIFSEITAQKIERIANNHNAGRIMSEIARLTGRVMLGVLPLERFVTALSEHVGIDINSAAEIAQDINRQIFFPVRDSLRILYGLSPTEMSVPVFAQGATSAKSAFPGAKSPDQLIPQRKGEITFEKPRESTEREQTQAQPPYPQTSETKTGENKQPEAESAQTTEYPQSAAEAPQEPQKEPPHDLPTVGSSGAAKDPYKEPVGSEDTQSKFENPGAHEQKPKVRIDGNIIDLKTLNTD